MRALLLRLTILVLSLCLGVAVAAWIMRDELLVFLGRFDNEVLSVLSAVVSDVSSPYGTLNIETEPQGQGQFVKLSCERCRFSNDRLAKTPLLLDSLLIRGHYEKKQFRGELLVGKIVVGLFSSWDGERAVGQFTLGETAIADIYSTVHSIVPEVTTATISGSISGNGSFIWPEMLGEFKPKVRNFRANGLFEPSELKGGTFHYTVRGASGRRMRREIGEGTPSWLPLSKLGQHLPAAIIAAEDGAFYSHGGYDLGGILEAAKDNKQRGRIHRGGSTLSQQLAKNLFLDSQRTYARKLRELLYAVQLESDLGKQRILELYLNVVEWGPGVFGAMEAANLYFGKSASALLPEEAAWMASILRSPRVAYQNQFLKNKPRTWRVEIILNRMNSLSEPERKSALRRPLKFRPSPNTRESTNLLE